MDKDRMKWMSIQETKTWMMAVLIEGEDLIKLSNESVSLMDDFFDQPGVNLQMKNRMDYIRELSRVREYYFVIALNKVQKWLNVAVKYDEEYQQMIDEINEKIPYIKEVRNMREHEIEYFEGKGNKQKDFIRGDDNVMSDATSTINNPDNYLVGGRISVQQVNVLFRKLHPKAKLKFENMFS
ncbi:hypothetical protein [Guptibacillus hwajinpoensis]|uniref:Uncharacterized protein n=1 Tax=Guptibacillus hwajinpoensis TaxID=208199 RepID=A0A0J6CQS7_9BACL|nr:hypothetical protein [Alkalihalobacillus macyae]KMM38606.1 hypothetical protein AB986_04840 [Alkalihalobacillus macyae]